MNKQKSNRTIVSSKNSKTLSKSAKEREKIKIFYGQNNKSLLENNRYGDNSIETTKYNLITWGPKSLLMQFKRAANIYFLVVSVLTAMSFSPQNPTSMIGTFAFVLVFTMLKELWEDLGRYKQDRAANNRLILKLINDEWVESLCWSLKSGDIIKILKNEEACADVLLLKSSNESGFVYIDTKNLDGETNLKERGCLEEFKSYQNSNFMNVEGSLTCDYPNEILTNWEGTLEVNGSSSSLFPTMKNVILKGCALKNTEFAIGLIVYCGRNTKIMKNSKNPIGKFSNVFKVMNSILYSVFIFDLVICVVFALLSIQWDNNKGKYFVYVKSSSTDSFFARFIVQFFVFFIAYSNIIPISLYVALELVKLAQGYLILYDNEIYYVDIDKPSDCRSTDLIEELGQVEFIFSDKTGTLTQNNMVLKKCYLNGKIYGAETSEKENQEFTINGDPIPGFKMRSTEESDKIEKENFENFFFLLALCHAVFPDKDEEGNLVYQGASPDDIALVKGAQQVGISFVRKEFTELVIHNKLLDKEMKFEFRVEMPFDSDRKRMSVIFKDKQTNKLLLLSKGADTTMMPRMDLTQKETEEFNRIIKLFSREGLRVLITGKKEITEEQYIKWDENLMQAKNRGEKDFSKYYEELENGINFTGLTAIEDKLQDGVPETIYTLLTCNIKIWVLTGDKQDTAEEIAKSCKLINDNMMIFYLFQNEEDNVDEKLCQFYMDFEIPFDDEETGGNFLEDHKEIFKQTIITIEKKIRRKMNKDLSIMIDGSTLDSVLGDEKLSKRFVYLAIAAKSVVCCRVSPKQKALVVQLAKKYGQWITLSIGDGANDVPMIMEAHIGVGIQGKEGTQAVRSADFSVGQFKYLEKLLLIYGRVGYLKISKFICYYFYKNIILVFASFYFAFVSGFSGQIYFADYLSTMYNAIFTSWPCIFSFSLEQDVELKIVKKFPILYEAGQKNYYFNLKVFWSYVLAAIFHGTLAYYISQLGLISIANDAGTTFDAWVESTVSFSLIIHIVTYKILVLSDFWNKMSLVICAFSIAFYYFVLYMLSLDFFSQLLQPQLGGNFNTTIVNAKYVLMVVLGPIFILIPDITLKQIFYNMKPNPLDTIKSHLNDPEFAKRVMHIENKIKLLDPAKAKEIDVQLAILLKKKKNDKHKVHETEGDSYVIKEVNKTKEKENNISIINGSNSVFVKENDQNMNFKNQMDNDLYNGFMKKKSDIGEHHQKKPTFNLVNYDAIEVKNKSSNGQYLTNSPLIGVNDQLKNNNNNIIDPLGD